jgi:hypothetical protein
MQGGPLCSGIAVEEGQGAITSDTVMVEVCLSERRKPVYDNCPKQLSTAVAPGLVSYMLSVATGPQDGEAAGAGCELAFL